MDTTSDANDECFSQLETMEEASEEPTLKEALANKTPDQRVQYLKRKFYQTEVPIQDMRQPVLCNIYPEFNDDILTAYFQYTTFLVKVWSNYDSACKKFFTDKRAEDCGKLVMSRKARDIFESLQSNDDIEINKIALDVGTAFKTLCRVVIRVSPVTGELKTFEHPETGDHPKLIRFIRAQGEQISGLRLAGGRSGFRLGDMEQVANWYYRQPDEVPKNSYQSRARYQDEWMDFSKGFTSNPGNIAGLHGYIIRW